MGDHLHDAVLLHLMESDWTVEEVNSSTADRVVGEVYEQELEDYAVQIKSDFIWEAEEQSGTWIVEVNFIAATKVSVDLTFYVYDYDYDEVELDKHPVYIDKQIKCKGFVRCSNVSEDNDPQDWEVEVDIALGDYEIDVGEVEPDIDDDYN